MKPITQQAHELLARHVRGSLAIDATAGNGYDTLFLAKLVGPSGTVWAFDIQAQALLKTASRLEEQQITVQLRLQRAGSTQIDDLSCRVIAIEANHAEMGHHLPPDARGCVSAIMFNLGYLPGADKACITAATSTLVALDVSLEYLAPEGVLSVVVYPGHPGGRDEAEAVRRWFARRTHDDSMTLLTDDSVPTHEGPQLLALRRK